MRCRQCFVILYALRRLGNPIMGHFFFKRWFTGISSVAKYDVGPTIQSADHIRKLKSSRSLSPSAFFFLLHLSPHCLSLSVRVSPCASFSSISRFPPRLLLICGLFRVEEKMVWRQMDTVSLLVCVQQRGNCMYSTGSASAHRCMGDLWMLSASFVFPMLSVSLFISSMCVCRPWKGLITLPNCTAFPLQRQHVQLGFWSSPEQCRSSKSHWTLEYCLFGFVGYRTYFFVNF